jgi:bacterioferritin (cytochrome b1)
MDSDLLTILETHKSIETENASSLKSIIEKTDSSIMKMFLSGIMLDSTKHAIMLQTILDLDAGQVLWNVDRDTMTRELQEHLNVEQKMLRGMQNIMVRTEGQNIQPFLKEILADERRHHQILSRLLEALQNIEALKEEWIDLYIRFQQEDFGRT